MPHDAPAVSALRRIAFLLELAREPTYRVRAFRRAADIVSALSVDELEGRIRQGSLQQLAGIGAVTAMTITEAQRGETPVYLRRLESTEGRVVADDAVALRAALRGDCHTHSDWSDGGSSIQEMAETARSLGHEYVALTDHSPRLTVARGLSAERLRRQLEEVERLNGGLSPFRILTGIEVDINEDGSLDQEEDLLGRLDIVVASVHSYLRMPREQMTERMLRAVTNPLTNVLGHCTGRMVAGRGRPESEFDADAVFDACRRFDVAVEINSRPERLDPPKRLLRLALEAGCRFAIDSDAHAPGQLGWQMNGCERAAACGVMAERVINTLTATNLVAWADRA
ncbi:MAG TPA: PHP domain-containing protein [Candidatus Acidoferrum sp.]|nr:PHP domain-containing protein [Candidatus Acidoferrum sp.]